MLCTCCSSVLFLRPAMLVGVGLNCDARALSPHQIARIGAPSSRAIMHVSTRWGNTRDCAAVVSNSTFDRGSLSPTYIKPFDVFANGGKTGDWLLGLDSNQQPSG
jgi:hypothetical protein